MTTPFYTIESLGPNQKLTPEGFLVVHNVPLARTGPQLYHEREVPVKGDSNGRVIIDRDPEEVFRPETIASLQGKPVVVEHPDEDVTPENYRDLAVGHVINPRQGTGVFDNLLLGDLLITCPDAINAVREKRLREVSVGYEADYEDSGGGRGKQRNILANHLALVQDGRCGPICRIGDQAYKGELETTDQLNNFADPEYAGGLGKGQVGDVEFEVKLTKAQANYTDRSADDHERCGACQHFLSRDTCELVQGTIDREGWCRLFEFNSYTTDWSLTHLLGQKLLTPKKRRHIHLHL